MKGYSSVGRNAAMEDGEAHLPWPAAQSSEIELQRQLDLPRESRHIVDGARRPAEIVERAYRPNNGYAIHRAAVPRENNLVRVREIGVIEKIEYLRPELQIESLV